MRRTVQAMLATCLLSPVALCQSEPAEALYFPSLSTLQASVADNKPSDMRLAMAVPAPSSVPVAPVRHQAADNDLTLLVQVAADGSRRYSLLDWSKYPPQTQAIRNVIEQRGDGKDPDPDDPPPQTVLGKLTADLSAITASIDEPQTAKTIAQGVKTYSENISSPDRAGEGLKIVISTAVSFSGGSAEWSQVKAKVNAAIATLDSLGRLDDVAGWQALCAAITKGVDEGSADAGRLGELTAEQREELDFDQILQWIQIIIQLLISLGIL